MHLHLRGLHADAYTDSYSAAKSNTDTYVVTVPHTCVDIVTYSETYTRSEASPYPGTPPVGQHILKNIGVCVGGHPR